jgi:hypothetical protein
MIILDRDQLSFRFPEMHQDAVLNIEFQRTLRIPDDNREYALPPGLGRFPLTHVDDYSERLPKTWAQHGGVFLPMYQAEALWIYFRTHATYPFAIKIAAGKIDAVTGEAWSTGLTQKPQNYVVAPTQPWLDGFCVRKGVIRQFVAMPLGQGFTAEEQLTGQAEHGGLQILVYPMKAEIYEAIIAARVAEEDMFPRFSNRRYAQVEEMGLAPGGLMRQSIYDDPHGIDVWDRNNSSRCFIHILNSLEYAKVTGTTPPTKPPTAKDYTQAGLPWFDYYDAEQTVLEGTEKLAGLDSVAAVTSKKMLPPFPDNEPLEPKIIQTIKPIRESDF